MLNGIEVSETYNWSQANASFAFIHYGSGVAGLNQNYAANVAGAKSRGIPYGAILTIKPEKSFKKQAEILEGLFDNPLPTVALVNLSAGMTKQKLMDYLLKMFNLTFELSGNKRRPIISTNIGFWDKSVARNDFAKRHMLMVYRWTTASNPGAPLDWSDINNPVEWTFWNYGKSADGNGLVRFNGNESAFKGLFDVDPSAYTGNPEPPAPVDPTKATTKYRSNLRKSPYGDILATIDPGIEFRIVEKKDDHYGVIVYLHESVVRVV